MKLPQPSIVQMKETLPINITLESFHNWVMIYMEREFMAKKELDPTWILQSGRLGLAKIVVPYSGGEHKDQIAKVMSDIINSTQFVVNRYSYYSEAWMIESPKGVSKEEADEWMKKEMSNRNSLESHPQRREVVMVQSCEPDRAVSTTIQILRRTWKVSLETKRELIHESKVESRFGNLYLPPENKGT